MILGKWFSCSGPSVPSEKAGAELDMLCAQGPLGSRHLILQAHLGWHAHFPFSPPPPFNTRTGQQGRCFCLVFLGESLRTGLPTLLCLDQFSADTEFVWVAWRHCSRAGGDLLVGPTVSGRCRPQAPVFLVSGPGCFPPSALLRAGSSYATCVG